MGFGSKRSLRVLLLSIFIILVFLLWKFLENVIQVTRKPAYPAQLVTKQGQIFSVPKDMVLLDGIAYAIVIPNGVEWTRLETLISSLQMHILFRREHSQIFVFYYRSTEIKAFRPFKLVKTCELDILLGSMMKEFKDSKESIIWAIPNILEYLLIEYSTVIFVDFNYSIEEKTIPQVLQTAAKLGEVIVPGQEYIGRTTKLNIFITDSIFPLLAYTRAGFVNRIKPYLDCRKGLKCDENIIKNPAPGSIINRRAIALHKIGLNQKIDYFRKDHQLHGLSPILEETFKFLDYVDESRLDESKKLKIGLGLEILPMDTIDSFINDQIKPLIKSIFGQDYRDYLILIYITNKSNIAKAVIIHSLRSIKASDEILFKIAPGTILENGGISTDMSSIAAFEDGCQHFYRFGQPPIIPKASTNWLTSLVRSSVPRHERLVLVTLVDNDDAIWMVRELIGSIHGALAVKAMKPPPLINIVGSNISKSNQAMIKLWEYVDYHDLDELLFGYSVGITSIDNPWSSTIRLAIIDIFIRRFGNVTWIDSRVVFTETADLERIRLEICSKGIIMAEMIVAETIALVLEGYDDEIFGKVHSGFTSGLMKKFNDSKYEEVVDYSKVGNVQNAKDKFHLTSLLPKPIDIAQRSQMYCHLAIRQDIMYNPILGLPSTVSQWSHPELDIEILNKTRKIKIAFLIPSKNIPDEEPDKVHLVQTFITSMLNSIEPKEWSKFQYSIYVGYDQEDPILDKQRTKLIKEIDKILEQHKDDVLVKYHVLPPAKCITLLWNILFIDATADGNDYFYQVNDDVSILTSGWTTKFVDKLRENDDFGVLGPNDQLWQCRLLTQSFVSRKHYEIFRWYFPTNIKDWYSDNWITQVYGPENTFCMREFVIKNGAAKTRYNICDKPRWREAVAMGKAAIQKWRQSNFHRAAMNRIDKS